MIANVTTLRGMNANELSGVLDGTFETIDGPGVQWQSLYLGLRNSVAEAWEQGRFTPSDRWETTHQVAMELVPVATHAVNSEYAICTTAWGYTVRDVDTMMRFHRAQSPHWDKVIERPDSVNDYVNCALYLAYFIGVEFLTDWLNGE